MPEMPASVLPRLTRLSETVVDDHQTRYRISPPPAERAVETDPDQTGGSKVGIDQRDAGPPSSAPYCQEYCLGPFDCNRHAAGVDGGPGSAHRVVRLIFRGADAERRRYSLFEREGLCP